MSVTDVIELVIWRSGVDPRTCAKELVAELKRRGWLNECVIGTEHKN